MSISQDILCKYQSKSETDCIVLTYYLYFRPNQQYRQKPATFTKQKDAHLNRIFSALLFISYYQSPNLKLLPLPLYRMKISLWTSFANLQNAMFVLT